MTKSDLIAKIAQKVPNLSQKDTSLVVNTVFDSMANSLIRGERIEIRGFASFSIRERNAREGRNPKTGDIVAVPDRKTVHFKPGKEMVERLNDR